MEIIWIKDKDCPHKPFETLFQTKNRLKKYYSNYNQLAIKMFIKDWISYFKYKLLYNYWKSEKKDGIVYYKRTNKF